MTGAVFLLALATAVVVCLVRRRGRASDPGPGQAATPPLDGRPVRGRLRGSGGGM